MTDSRNAGTAAVGALVACVLGAGVGVVSGPTAQASINEPVARVVVDSPQPPSTGSMLGVYAELVGKGALESVRYRESQLGRQLAIDHHYYNWTDSFPGKLEAADAADGRIPLISWLSVANKQVANGSQDAVIRARAQAVKSFRGPVFLRWGFEMNGDWWDWNGTKDGKTAAVYVAAWKRIHGIFQSVGATNAAFVWCPNANSRPGGLDLTSWNNWRRYYPGDAYVDWVGIDGYNWGGTYWQSFGSIMSPVYRDYAGRKPIMIAETSSVEQGGNKSAWISDMRRGSSRMLP